MFIDLKAAVIRLPVMFYSLRIHVKRRIITCQHFITGFSGFFGSQPKGLPIPYGFTYNAGIIGTENGICDRPPVEKYARRYIEGCSELLGTISCERSGVGKLLSPFPVADSEMFEVQGNIHPVAYIFFNIHLINHKEVDPVVF